MCKLYRNASLGGKTLVRPDADSEICGQLASLTPHPYILWKVTSQPINEKYSYFVLLLLKRKDKLKSIGQSRQITIREGTTYAMDIKTSLTNIILSVAKILFFGHRYSAKCLQVPRYFKSMSKNYISFYSLSELLSKKN